MPALLEAPVTQPPRRAQLKTAPVPLPAAAIGLPKLATAAVPSVKTMTVPFPVKQDARPWHSNSRLRVIGVSSGNQKARPLQAPPAPVLNLSVLPSAEELRTWVESPVEGQLRFALAGPVTIGNLEKEEAAYFDSDYATLMAGAASIAAALGLSPASVAACAEPARAVCYWRLTEGCAGTYGAAGSTVAGLLGSK
jgi:hypothetical protein